MDAEMLHKEEVVLRGVAAAPGIAIGKAYLYDKQTPKVVERHLGPAEVDSEIERLKHALQRSTKELEKILSFAEQKIGDRKAKIFEAQIMILHDELLFREIERRIRDEAKSADFIVSDEIGKYQRLMLSAEDEYMRERAFEVEDVKNRIIRNIHQHRLFSKLEGASVIVSETLTAADTVLFSRNEVLGYATDFGGVTSHAAILSRSLRIPAVVGLHKASKMVSSGDLVIIDGFRGLLIVHPSQERLQEYEEKLTQYRRFEVELERLHDLPAETLDHHRVRMLANLEFADEVSSAKQQGAEGIGLFRTESLLINRDDFPSEDEQALIYDSVAAKAFPDIVVIRTFDIGGDKVMLDSAAPESNPFLGWRGIRIGLDRTELLLTQLRAILRASGRKNVAIMLPMVATLKEVRRVKRFLEQAKEELRSASIPFDDAIPLGVMIEVPSAAVMAEQIAKEVDFLSIGTNDLIQYTLAVDRGNDNVAKLYSEFDPSILWTLKHIIDSAHRAGRKVSICGEMAGNPVATILLLGFGLDEFSMVPSLIPGVKKVIRSVTLKEAQRIAKAALEFTTVEEVEEFLREGVKTYVSPLLLLDREE